MKYDQHSISREFTVIFNLELLQSTHRVGFSQIYRNNLLKFPVMIRFGHQLQPADGMLSDINNQPIFIFEVYLLLPPIPFKFLFSLIVS